MYRLHVVGEVEVDGCGVLAVVTLVVTVTV